MRSSLLLLSICLAFSLEAQPDTELKLCPLGGVGFELPDSIRVGDTLRYAITYTLPDGCANLIDMKIQETATAVTHWLFRECPTIPCTDIVRGGMASALFVAKNPGLYSFQVGAGDQKWTSATLVVYKTEE